MALASDCRDPLVTDTPAPPRTRLRFGLKFAAAVVVLAGALALSFAAYTGALGENFRAVVPERAYRSGQMSAATLKDALAAHGIKCVVNLLGEHPAAGWYEQELGVCQTAGVQHDDINIGLGKLPPPEALQALAVRLKTGPYPMLWHCRHGVDRSGLAAVLYLMIVEKRSLDDAIAHELTWHNGHFPLGAARSVDRVLELYRQTGHGRDIQDWITQDYPAVYAKE